MKQQQLVDSLVISLSLVGVGLGVALLFLAVGIHYLRSWYRGGDDPADSSNEILKQMRELRLEGDLSEEEFRSIKSQIIRRTEM